MLYALVTKVNCECKVLYVAGLYVYFLGTVSAGFCSRRYIETLAEHERACLRPLWRSTPHEQCFLSSQFDSDSAIA